MEIAVPEGCTLIDVTFLAETDDQFKAAAEALGLTRAGDVSNTSERKGESFAYRYALAYGTRDDVRLTLRGPRHEMKLVPADV